MDLLRFDPPARPDTQAACTQCPSQIQCFAQRLDEDILSRVAEHLIRRTLRQGEPLYRMGDAFDALYFVRDGFFKSAVPGEQGQDYILGFAMSGDVLGLDGWVEERHHSQVTALRDGMVCLLGRQSLLELSFDLPSLQQSLHRMMSREITRQQKAMLALISLPAEQRLLAFLQDLATQFHARGNAAPAFELPMTREEIAQYLGLKMETVSRAFTKLHADGHIVVRRRHIKIVATPPDAESVTAEHRFLAR